jgi:hypothetical protein
MYTSVLGYPRYETPRQGYWLQEFWASVEGEEDEDEEEEELILKLPGSWD